MLGFLFFFFGYLCFTGSLWEWKSNLVRNMGFFLDMMTLLMALGHYVLIWWLHGMAFHLVDAILLLNIRVCIYLLFYKMLKFIILEVVKNKK